MFALATMSVLIPLLLVEGQACTAASAIGAFFGTCSLAFGLVVFFDKPMQGKQYDE